MLVLDRDGISSLLWILLRANLSQPVRLAKAHALTSLAVRYYIVSFYLPYHVHYLPDVYLFSKALCPGFFFACVPGGLLARD